MNTASAQVAQAGTTAQVITDELRQWVVAQAQIGCRPEDVLAAMLASGWQEDVAIQAMELALTQHLGQSPQPPASAAPGRPPMPEPDLLGSPTVVHAGDRDVTVLLSLRRPRVVLFGNFMSAEECDELVALASGRLARSETVVNATGGSEVNSARTSDGMFFSRGENALCARIEKRIAALLRWPIQNGEGLQVLRYRPGAEYLPHHDYFDPAQPGAASILARGGQRVGTLVMYLNTPTKGGATTFPDAGLEVAPVKGNAVFFAYERADASSLTLHSGAPVVQGEKWVATKWLRQGAFH